MHLRRPPAYLAVVLCAVAPLFAPEVWTGFRLALSDPVLSVISAAEQPLSVRSPAGAWTVALTLFWWALAYRGRNVRVWEAALVLLGGAAALLRLGNAWLDALAMVVPLARQLQQFDPRPALLALAAGASILATWQALAASWPAGLPADASQAVVTAPVSGTILADWRWAPGLQRRLGDSHLVLAAGGLASESSDFWLDYLRIAQGHERWADALRQMNVDLVVLDASGQQHEAAVLVRASGEWRVLYDADGALIAQRLGS